jgi:hypothetical protein
MTIVGSIVAWLLARIQKRTDANTPGTPSVQEIWKRQDSMERAFRASLTLLVEVVEQHAEPGKLKLNAAAIKTLRESDYMPSELEEILTNNKE